MNVVQEFLFFFIFLVLKKFFEIKNLVNNQISIKMWLRNYKDANNTENNGKMNFVSDVTFCLPSVTF